MLARKWRVAGATDVPLTQGHVLVVEDDEDIRAVLRGVLTDEGYAVTTAANGKQALGRLAAMGMGEGKGGLDRIVLDHRMPVLDGPGFLTAYRALPGPHAPVLVSTSRPDPGIAGVAYLRRPFDVSVFLALVRARLKVDASTS